ncbi:MULTISPECIES: hypothetical protein [unclassified Streptomyces]|uniref:hypothetical protein n=1 Tax=unclassified Streptomyces TaxID=2593676 RepID=UPI003D7454EB
MALLAAVLIPGVMLLVVLGLGRYEDLLLPTDNDPPPALPARRPKRTETGRATAALSRR